LLHWQFYHAFVALEYNIFYKMIQCDAKSEPSYFATIHIKSEFTYFIWIIQIVYGKKNDQELTVWFLIIKTQETRVKQLPYQTCDTTLERFFQALQFSLKTFQLELLCRSHDLKKMCNS